MKIIKIYEKYKIMPQLQEHQLRVAAVAKLISDNFTEPLNKDLIITAALLHDMGNIIKFKLDLFPEFLEPQGLKYWENIKQEYITKYGDDEHTATNKIIKEISTNENIIGFLDGLSFSNTLELFKTNNIEKFIVKYSDLRVTPFGVDNLKNRLAEAEKRYVDNTGKYTEVEFKKLSSVWNNIEKIIFEGCKIKPSDITNEKVDPMIQSLKDFEIRTVAGSK